MANRVSTRSKARQRLRRLKVAEKMDAYPTTEYNQRLEEAMRKTYVLGADVEEEAPSRGRKRDEEIRARERREREIGETRGSSREVERRTRK